jgi:arylformamidase
MKFHPVAATLLLAASCLAQEMKRSIPYIENGHARHVLDVYAPANAKNLPVVFWIHGGGWQTGDKANVQEKPAWFTKKGFVFVAINHRLLPEVTMDVLVRDVAKAFGWMHNHIAEHGGDRNNISAVGHSAGGHLVAMLLGCDWKKVGRDLPAGLLRKALSISGLFDLAPMRKTPFLQDDLRLTPAQASH